MELRLLSGCYRNRLIKMPAQSANVRPTTIRSRVIIFDTIKNYIDFNNSYILDAFAGSGMLGIECLSRGAQHVYFFDINPLVCKNININLKGLNFPGMYDVFNKNALTPIKGRPMNLIFLDPPYHLYFLTHKIIKNLIKFNWINESTIIVLEQSCVKYTNLNDIDHNKFNFTYNVFKEKLVSRSLIRFLTINFMLNHD